MSINVTITEQGLTSLINAQNNGSTALKLTEAKLGKGRYTPDAQQSELVEPFKTLSTIAGKVVEDHLIHLTVKDESADEYEVGEFGIYTDTGVLFAVYSDPDQDNWILEKDALATLLLAIDISLQSVTTDCIEFGNIELISPPATYSDKGVVQLADKQSVLEPKHDQVPTVDALHHLIKHLFVGQVSAFACAQPPTGWLVADGASLQRSEYPDLWAFAQSSGNLALSEADKALGQSGPGNGLTSFTLPDLRGEFIRAVNNERVIGSSEEDSLKSHTHSGKTKTSGAHSHNTVVSKSGVHTHTGSSLTSGDHSHTSSMSPAGTHSHSGSTTAAGNHAHGLHMPSDIVGSHTSYNYKGVVHVSWDMFSNMRHTHSTGSHTHALSINGVPNHRHNVSINIGGGHSHGIDIENAGEHDHQVTVESAGIHDHNFETHTTGGVETRPRNVALLMCIKY